MDFSKLPSSAKDIVLSIITDAFNDPDDVLAILLLVTSCDSIARINVITTLYNPKQKAELMSRVLTEIDCHHKVKICIGTGEHDPNYFMRMYGYWPKPWGVPGKDNLLSLGQGLAYSDLGECPAILSTETPEDVLMEASSGACEHIILGLAPLTDLGNVLHRLQHVNRIIITGGFFGSIGNVTRPGYNTAIDPQASLKVLQQTRVPVLVFNSQQISEWGFSFTEEEVVAIFKSTEKSTRLAHMVANDMAFYWKNKKPVARGKLHIVDVVGMYIGIMKPEYIKTTTPVWFHEGRLLDDKNDPIHMLHPLAKEVLQVQE